MGGRDDGEPTWAVDGTYMVARRIRMRVEFWDRTALHTQEAIIGRLKDTGAPLDGVYETDVPAYASDQDGSSTPLTADIRLAIPAVTDREDRILRLGFNFSQGFTPDGQLHQGLAVRLFPAQPRRWLSRGAGLGSTAKHSRSTSGRSVAASTSCFPGVSASPDGYLGEVLLS